MLVMLRRASRVSPSCSLHKYISVRNYSKTLTKKSSASESKKKVNVKLERLAEVLSRAERQGDKYGWTYTPKRGAAEARLRDALGSEKDAKRRVPSVERLTFFTSQELENANLDDVMEAVASAKDIEPGSFIELRRDKGVVQGIILGTSQSGQQTHPVVLASNGEIWTPRTTDIMFLVPSFVEADLVARCGTEPIAETPQQMASRLLVLKRTRDFERAIESAVGGAGFIIGQLYPLVCADDPDEWASINTIEAARITTRHQQPEVPLLTLLAVHKHLMERADEFVAHPTAHKELHMFKVRPKSHLTNIKTVIGWLQSKDTVIFQFTAKARNLIDQHRALSQSHRGELPRQTPVAEVFSASDREIIRFLRHSLQSMRTIQNDPYAPYVPSIVKAVERYRDKVDTDVVQALLTEIGVLTPWEDLASVEVDTVRRSPLNSETPALPLPKPTGRIVKRSRTNEVGLLAVDPHESVRHDFGSLPVYVIDDVYAEELDDGISLEHIAAESDTVWLHVHIADPTAMIPLEHPVVEQARRQMETVYFIHKTNPLLPPSLGVPDLSNRSSKNRSKSSEGLNVLTFSIKVDSHGDIVDYKIRPARINNVHVLRYDDVDAVLLPGMEVRRFIERPFEPTTEDFVPNLASVLPHKEALKEIYAVTTRMKQSRLRYPSFSYTQASADLSMSPKPPPTSNPDPVAPVFFTGFPRLTYAVVDTPIMETGARSMIAEAAKATGRIASRFCLEHGIPAIRRRGNRPEVQDDVFQRLLAMRSELGFVEALEVLKAGVPLGATFYTLEPGEHWSLAIPAEEGYVRATSPLRRFADMVAHWQIKSVLLPSSKQRGPPFSEDEMLKLMSELLQSDRLRKRVMRHHERYWQHLYIHQYMERLRRAGKDPSTAESPVHGMTGHIIAETRLGMMQRLYSTDVHIPSLGIIGDIVTQRDEGWAIGDRVTVNVNRIDMGLTPNLILEKA